MGPPMAPPGMAPPGLPMPPPAFIAPPGTVPEPGQGMKNPMGPMDDDDATPAKKARTEDNLIPENEFLVKQKVCLSVFIAQCTTSLVVGLYPYLSLIEIYATVI